MNIKYIALAATVLSSTIAFGQTKKEQIETISISGARAPISVGSVAGSVTIIDEERIVASGAIGITELLRGVAGVNIGQTGPRGSLTEVRFRGSESNHILVLIDGVSINDLGQGGLTDFSHLLLSNIARIEILRGPQSAIWGSSAIGGIISITTKQSNSRKLQLSTGAGIGTKGTTRLHASASQRIDKLKYHINASTYSSKGENISKTGEEDDAYRNTDFSGGVQYNFNDDNKVNLTARAVDFSADADAYDFSTGLVSDANAVAEGEQISVGINWHFAPTQGNSAPSIYSQLLSFQYSAQASDNFTNNIFERSSEGETFRLLWTNQFRFASSNWLNLGLESTSENFVQRGASADNEANQNQSTETASFVTDGQYGLSKRLFVSMSYRYDNNSEFDNASSYRIGSTYSFTNNWRLFVSKGSAIKNPTFVERFGFFPNSFLGNKALKPEKQTSVEAGIEASFDHVSIQLNWFNADLEDEILGFVFDPDSGQFTAQNAQTTSQRQGFEISANGNSKKLSWQAQYSYLDASEGNSAELRRSRHTASISTSYTFDSQHQWYVQADYSGTKFDRFFPPFPEQSQIVTLSSYWLVSANYVYTYTEKLSLNLRFSNLLNADYEDVFSYNNEGQRALLSVMYNWN